ncbi:extracellular solute-binding protein family 5 [Syntrophobotulus glycolicus DSM 8271]|uniref:Extracellular solute-binding protein family 5 n=1 Tax=Syntrophobotulus glycolicus (strain DSM 8271 / FlGlyR) TaxID=645991 RepID=F0SWK2_SYNGF|nr:ABC transporter substrate-binding protein [Syntrophobotulus glycolicus]ADY56842.1 extracellular solute-binding protein family 5 [Syntrophobotulus glycolicus DSM 8271]
MIRQRFKSLSFVLLLVLMTTLSGCGTSGQTGGTEQEHRLVVDLANEPATLDPGLQYNTDSYTVYRNIFDNLLRRDSKTLEIQPWVAESWKQENENTWTFAIRSDIKFQNGAPLTAQDVAFSIRRILDKDFKSPQYANYSQITEVNASGNVVTITTDGPSPSLLAQLVNLSIVPEKYVKESGNENFNLHPIGSGAYKFSDWQKGVEINLETNPDYWQGKPSISGVRFRFVSNPASRIADLQSGQADIALALNADDIEVLKSNNDLQTLSVATERVAYLALNCLGDSPTKSVNVRQAIAYGINYESIISSLLKGYGKPVKEVLTPLSFGYDDTVEGYTYNPEKAKQLLKDAGLEKITIEFPTSPAYDQRIIQAIQGDLSKVGIDVKIVNSDQATYLKKVQDPAHNWGGIRFGIWSSGTMDAHGTILPLFRTGTVWSSYSNKEFDAAVTAAGKTTDTAVRLENYKKAFAILQEEVPGIGLWQAYNISAASKHLQWQPDAQENFFVRDMKWTN